MVSMEAQDVVAESIVPLMVHNTEMKSCISVL